MSQPSEELEAQPFEELEEQPFEIIEVQMREYRRFNTRGTQWKVRLNLPPETPLLDLVTHFVDSVNNLFDHVLEDVGDAYMAVLTIHNEVNQSDKLIGFSFRRISYHQMSYGACLTSCRSLTLDSTIRRRCS